MYDFVRQLQCTKYRPRKNVHYAKAYWKTLDQDFVRLANEIGIMREKNTDAETMWKHFKTSSAERYIPSRRRRSSYNRPMDQSQDIKATTTEETTLQTKPS